LSFTNRLQINVLPDSVKNWYLKLITPVVELFVRLELNPNFFTTIGFILTIGGAVLFAAGHLVSAGIIVLLAGTFDIIDGKVARATNRVTRFGALYDSTLDRYSEVIMFFGMAFHFVKADMFITSIAVSFALGGSIMVDLKAGDWGEYGEALGRMEKILEELAQEGKSGSSGR
jgi:CDP-diacylglycerol--glycerol-3-phosphate 3-phosphatidyltransferase